MNGPGDAPPAGAQPLPVLSADSYEAACSLVDGCLVCGDVAVPVTVVEAGAMDALCEDGHGQRGTVGVELVSPVAVGQRLLVHGGVAISRLEEAE
jgi:hydrogenase expression/formation protein HypC